MYRVIYKLIHGDFLLSNEMSLEAACDFRNVCLSKGYDTAFVVQVIG